MREYRIEAVAPWTGSSQVDFVFPSAIYTLKRRDDKAVFKIRMSMDPKWAVGEILRIEDWHIQAALVH